jgi:hypothetical protein
VNWYLVTLTKAGAIVERGWMLARTDTELIDYARTMRYDIDIEFLGRADMAAVTCEIVQ